MAASNKVTDTGAKISPAKQISAAKQISPAKKAEKIRLAAALRENLKRRKAQLRSRRTNGPPQDVCD